MNQVVNALSYDVIADLILFDDPATAIEKLKPFGLALGVNRDGDYVVVDASSSSPLYVFKNLGGDAYALQAIAAEPAYPEPEQLTIDFDAQDEKGCPEKEEYVEAKSDERTVNNTVRHAYRVLNEDEKLAMQNIKDLGQEFLDLIAKLGQGREYSIARTKMEEAVMWAVKGLTA